MALEFLISAWIGGGVVMHITDMRTFKSSAAASPPEILKIISTIYESHCESLKLYFTNF